MGACSCSTEPTNADATYDPERLNYLVRQFKNNSYFLTSLIRIQSIIRGIISRNDQRIKFSKSNNIKLVYDSDNDYSKFYEIDKCPLTEKDLLNVINSYPILNDKYEVEIKKPVEYEDSSIYYGEWLKGSKLRHGRGIQLWEDGTRYEGYFENNKANLKGKLIHSDGDIFEGNWFNGKAEGFGVYKHIDGSIYKGNWKQDKQHGKGEERWPDGSYYKGDYFLGKKQGNGIFAWADGSIYEGEFENNLINGKGKYIWNDGRVYIGSWQNNKMNGRGIFKWLDKRIYEGEYYNDKKQGYGVFSWPDGRKYKGCWSNGKQHGKGDFFNPIMKNWKSGQWSYGKRLYWDDEKENQNSGRKNDYSLSQNRPLESEK